MVSTPTTHSLVDTSLLKYLTELLQSEPYNGRAVYSVSVPKEVGLAGIDAGYPEYEFTVVLVIEDHRK
ncbi:hypothetical protein V496_02070 [Pseudogymnoascus sp. VKM F-4515 (FW-2607)]|nr:hypothetical protein V496_02070 [Pseudogymnoascus sp. VKM F-4515 (FW-2607)]